MTSIHRTTSVSSASFPHRKTSWQGKGPSSGGTKLMGATTTRSIIWTFSFGSFARTLCGPYAKGSRSCLSVLGPLGLVPYRTYVCIKIFACCIPYAPLTVSITKSSSTTPNSGIFAGRTAKDSSLVRWCVYLRISLRVLCLQQWPTVI